MSLNAHTPLKERQAVEDILRQGKCAVVVVAGGDGSRLGFNGPKGCYPITPIRKHSLFQRLAEKVLYASRLYRQPFPLAIMTSPANHAATQAYFVQHRYFGLASDQVLFFSQPTLPLLNDAFKPIYHEDGTLITGPDGNGSFFNALAQSTILDKWIADGISFISLIPIDNPLAMPFDIELMAMQQYQESPVAMTVVPRIDPLESVGVVKREGKGREGRVTVVEYSELTPQERQSCEGDAHIGIFSFSIAFAKQAAEIELPIHYARKRIRQLQQLDLQACIPGGASDIAPGNALAWKQERFIFDILPFASRTSVLRRDRAECFAPLKQKEGWGDPSTVQQALMRYDRQLLAHYLEQEIPEGPIELSPCFYYSTMEYQQRWKAALRASSWPSFWPSDGYFAELREQDS